MFDTFPIYRQHDQMDCGPSCLRMIAAFYGKKFSLQYLREQCFISREGVSLQGIMEAAKKLCFRTMAVKISFEMPDTSNSNTLKEDWESHLENTRYIIQAIPMLGFVGTII